MNEALKERLERALGRWLADSSLQDLGDPIEAILAELAAAGYAVVPREPTLKMLEAVGGSPFALPREIWRQEGVAVWQAMLAAAEEEG